MTHEPECLRSIYTSERETCACTCDGLRAAYERGREDAAKAVSTETCHTKECDFDRAGGLICYCGYEAAIAAARGESEQ